MKHHLARIFLFLQLSQSSLTQSTCVDRPYFHYDCSQLAPYCRSSRATGIRASCPVTCGVCQKDLPRPPGDQRTPDRGIVRLGGPEEGENGRVILATVTPGRIPQSSTSQWSPKPTIGQHPTVVSSGQSSANAMTDGQRPMSTGDQSVQITPDEGPRITTGDQQGQISAGEIQASSRSISGQKSIITDQDANQRLSTCCLASLIRPGCSSLCSYDVRKEEVLLKSITGQCTLDDARIWIHCGADGNQNVQCCRNRGVIGCEEACNGQLGDDLAQLLGCLNNYFETIVQCHRENLR